MSHDLHSRCEIVLLQDLAICHSDASFTLYMPASTSFLRFTSPSTAGTMPSSVTSAHPVRSSTSSVGTLASLAMPSSVSVKQPCTFSRSTPAQFFAMSFRMPLSKRCTPRKFTSVSCGHFLKSAFRPRWLRLGTRLCVVVSSVLMSALQSIAVSSWQPSASFIKPASDTRETPLALSTERKLEVSPSIVKLASPILMQDVTSTEENRAPACSTKLAKPSSEIPGHSAKLTRRSVWMRVRYCSPASERWRQFRRSSSSSFLQPREMKLQALSCRVCMFWRTSFTRLMLCVRPRCRPIMQRSVSCEQLERFKLSNLPPPSARRLKHTSLLNLMFPERSRCRSARLDLISCAMYWMLWSRSAAHSLRTSVSRRTQLHDRMYTPSSLMSLPERSRK
mmetsp:Transcript_24442/g.76640  ORF Transcript_24442/g.76640 Transcript_24442/m.76640 type:complete len:392 (-) Transcript_24442:465-1640(-)